MSKKKYQMDKAEEKLSRLHDEIDAAREICRGLLKSLDSMADDISTMRSLSLNWRVVGREMNGFLDIPPDEEMRK